MTKRLEVYQAIVALAVDGVCEATQAEIAARAGVSRVKAVSILRSLTTRGLITVQKTDRHHGAGARHRYELSNQKVTQSPELSNQKVTQSPELSNQKVTQSQNEIMIHACMHDKNTMKNKPKKSKLEKAEILTLLDFLDPGERQKRARQRHVTVAYARQWRAWYDAGDFGEIANPPGYINWAIQRKQDPPGSSGQIALPGGAIDLTSALPILPPPTGLDSLWAGVLADLRSQMTEATFTTLLQNTTLNRTNGYYEIVASAYATDWLKNRWSDQVTSALAAATGGPVQIKFITEEEIKR